MVLQANGVAQEPLFAYPVLRPGYQVIPLTADAVCLRCLDHSFVIRGPAAALVARLLEGINGSRDVSQLAAYAQIEPTLVIQILTRLAQAKIIVEKEVLLAASYQDCGGAASLLAHMYLPAQTEYTQAVQTISHCLTSQVVVISGSSDLAPLLSTHCSQSGIKQVHVLPIDQLEYAHIAPLAPTFLLHVERVNDYRAALQVNALALRLHIPWVAGWQTGFYLNVTHVMIPGENACFECLLLRQQRNYMHFAIDLAYEQFLRHEHPTLSFQESLPSLDHLLASFMGMRMLSFLLGHRPSAPAPRLLEFSPVDMESMQHPVLRLPHCPACGPLNSRTQTYPYLDASFFSTDANQH
jgi:bacteriocin biosynthesis cyclodehydratase domain-containing protein